MSNSAPANHEGSATTDTHRLPPRIGIDADGLVHHVAARFPRQAILTEPDGEPVTERDLHGRTREEWVEYVRQERGWAACWADERLTPAEIDRRLAEVR